MNNNTTASSKKYFALKLIPPRSSFAQDMTEEERKIMQAHVAYWMDLMDQKRVIVFGPVLDPQGTYGLGVVEADNEEQLNNLIKNDPAVQINKYEVYPMLAVLPKKNA